MWYVIQTVSGKEQSCAGICRARIDSSLYNRIFVPMYIDKLHFKGKWHDVKKVLFPGYFFIDTEEIDAVSDIISGIELFAKILKNAEKPSPIHSEEKNFLQSMMDDEYIIHCSKGFIIGEKICITEGPLRNHYGLIRKIDRHRRTANLEINFFGRMTPAEVGLEVLARLTEDEFRELKEKSMGIYCGNVSEKEIQPKQKKLSHSKVNIKSGVFAGMSGVFQSGNTEKDEWHVKVNLFDTPTEVVFSREEISFCN